MNDDILSEYLAGRANSLVSKFMRICIGNPRETGFMIRSVKTIRNDNKKRIQYENDGLHVPVFLISSITTSCNMFCKGCYARAEHICGKPLKTEMSLNDWESVFCQAEELGITFNIIAGGEPMMRRDIIHRIAEHENTIFPIFTNGTMIDKEYLDLFDRHRNLIPILSIEGKRQKTDDRRGPGTYDNVMEKMRTMNRRGLLFGTSITVTKENQDEVISEDLISTLENNGCKAVFLIEFVAADHNLSHLAPDTESRAKFDIGLENIRSKHKNMVIMSFPGDERKMGGCIGGGRGFFHINPYGDAEACPASPYSDTNVMNGRLEDVLKSELFHSIRKDKLLSGEHDGGCALLENESRIVEIVNGNR